MSFTRRDFLARSAVAAAAPPLLRRGPPLPPADPTLTRSGARPFATELLINGTTHKLEIETRTTLLEALRWKIGLSGAKEVCDRGACGACTVLVDGKPHLACMTLAADLAGAAVTTVEGLGTPQSPGKVQAAFIRHDGLQCGYCIPGFIVSVEGALRAKPQCSARELKEAISGNLCRCGSYGKIFEALEELAGGRPELGLRRNEAVCLENEGPRLDAPEKVAGTALYSADVKRDGLLFARHVLCPYGKARLASADLEAARRLPGVLEVEIEAGREYRYSGAPIGHVCAESPAALRDAVQALQLRWEPEWIQADPMALHQEQHGAFPPAPEQLGSAGEVSAAKAALEQAAVVVEATYHTQIQTHSTLEPHGGMVDPTVKPVEAWMSTQGTFTCVEGVGQELGLDPKDFQVKCEYVGGGFGSKFGPGREGALAARLAAKHGRPVRVFNDREGEQLDTGNRPGSAQWMRIGAAKDGKLLGGYIYTAGTVGVGGGGGMPNPSRYDFGAVARKHVDVKGFHGAPRAFRAPGHPQAMFAVESVLDELAEALGLDPVALRLRNETSEVRKEMLKAGMAEIGWERRRPSGSQTGRWRRGFGCGAADWGNGTGRCEIRLQALPDGSVHLYSGTQDIGTGHRTLLADLAADSLGAARRRITVHLANSHYPPGPASGGSTTGRVSAPAVRDAAAKLLAAVPGLAGKRAGDDGAWAAACRELPAAGVEATGSFNRDYWGQGGSETVQFAEVLADAETGVVQVAKVVALQACGLTVHRLAAENQVIGGVIQGISYALFEDRATDPQLGYQMNADLDRYKIAGALDVPEIVPILWGRKDGLGVRSLGEPPTVPTPGAIANAVANALGARVRSLPITPDKVLKALEGRA